MHEGGCRGALLGREQDHLRALARDVPGSDDARQRELGHEPDAHGAGRREIRPERSGQQHLLDVGDLHAELLDEQGPAGRDRGLGELELAHVALRQVDRALGIARLARPGEYEDPLALDCDQALRQHGVQLGRGLVGDEAPGVVEQAALDELRDGIDEPRAADSEWCAVADHAEHDLVAGDAHRLDRAVGGPHAAADLRRLEGRPGGCGGGEQPLGVAERDLTVRADVDEQAQPLVAGHAGGQQARDDVAADVRAECREDVRVRPRVHGDAEVGRPHERVARGGHDERSHADGLGIDAEHQLRHRRVARERDLVDLLGRDLAVLQHLADELGERGLRKLLQLRQHGRIHHGGGDPPDHIRAVRLLPVEDRAHRDRRPRREVEQGRHHGRGAEVERDAEDAARRVTGLDADQLVVDDDGRHLPVACAHELRQGAHDVDADAQFEVVHGREDALEIARLVLQRGLRELEVALLHARPEDHLPPDADGRRLGARLQRRHLDHEVAARLRATRQAPAVAQLVGCERARVDRADRQLALDDPHLALLARAVAAAGGVDRDPVPARSIEQADAGGHADLRPVRQEAQPYAADALAGHRLLRGHAHEGTAA